MPKIPRPPKTISQLVESQVPAFVREDYPQFLAFLKAYYEWLETNGTEVFTGRVTASTNTSVTLSGDTQPCEGMSLVVLNGPAKGHTRKIKKYDPATRNVVLETAWTASYVPPANTQVAIRDSFYPDRLLSYRDIDTTLDRFVAYFESEFLYQIPGTILADKRLILKNIKEFYRARGTEDSFRFLFRIMFGEEVEFYYPKVDLFRLSDGRWSVDKVMRVTTTTDTFDYVNRKVIGVVSGATANVESATQSLIAGHVVTDLKLSNFEGEFVVDQNTGLPEQIKIVYPTTVPPQTSLGSLTDLEEPSQVTLWESAYSLLQNLKIDSPGNDYVVGETITIAGGGELAPAKATVTAVHEKYFNGRVTPPPTAYYVQPFYGPNDHVNASGDPMKDDCCIPGLFFYSDVHSQFTESELVTPNEIILSGTETSTDDFFVGDEISLTGGTGRGQRKKVLSYNGATKVATVDTPFSPIPDGSTTYSIYHTRGGIKAVQVTDFGLGFVSSPSVTITSAKGSGATLPPFLGVVGQSAGQWLVGRDGGAGGAPTTTDSFLDSNKIIQDSYYWQEFSYDLRFGQTIDKYRDVVKSLLHPAGMKMFGTVMLKSKPETNFFETIQNVVLELEAKVFANRLTPIPTTVLELNTLSPQVIGAKNQDLDAMKFSAFPPNSTFSIQYPYPNQSYWAVGATGNTQIGNFKDIQIGTIISYPKRRTKISADSILRIDSTDTYARVGPIGPSKATIAKFRFLGFPPFEGFAERYPSPNAAYWDSYGNTQIGSFANMLLEDVIVDPQNKRSNFCVDGDVDILKDKLIPKTGDVCEYAFLQGINPQTVYNVSPNSHGEFDGVLGSSIVPDGTDPEWVDAGIVLDASASQIVNATGIPMNMTQCTVIVVAKANIGSDMSLVSSMPDGTTNGFSIDVRGDGGVSFRAQYAGTTKAVTFPTATVDTDYFLVALRFDRGVLSGRVNTSRFRTTRLAPYPEAPTTTSAGWYFGKPSADYVPAAATTSLFGSVDFGAAVFRQVGSTGTVATVAHFDGVLAYALFYDRPLYDFELDFIYQNLKTRLLEERNITLP